MSTQDSHNSERIHIRCECGKTYHLPTGAAGKRAKCVCGQVFTIQALPPENEPIPEPTKPENGEHQPTERRHLRPVSNLLLNLFIVCAIWGAIFPPLYRLWDIEIFKGLGVWLSLCAFILHLVLLYEIWAIIQIGRVRTTPGRAVGYLFIPLYQFFWLFEAYAGWTQDYNRVLLQYHLKGPRMSKTLGLAVCIVYLVLAFWWLISLCAIVSGNQHLARFLLSFLLVISMGDAFLVSAFFFKASACANFLFDKVCSRDFASVSQGVVRHQRTRMADWSLICGIIGPLTVGISAIPGLLLGLIALRKIRKSAGTIWGKGEAIAGVLLSAFILLTTWLPVLIMLLERY